MRHFPEWSYRRDGTCPGSGRDGGGGWRRGRRWSCLIQDIRDAMATPCEGLVWHSSIYCSLLDQFEETVSDAPGWDLTQSHISTSFCVPQRKKTWSVLLVLGLFCVRESVACKNQIALSPSDSYKQTPLFQNLVIWDCREILRVYG